MGRIRGRVVRMERQLDVWAERLDKLVVDAQSAAAQSDRHARIEQLRARLVDARARLREAKAAGAHRWEAFRDRLESAWGDVETAFRSLRA